MNTDKSNIWNANQYGNYIPVRGGGGGGGGGAAAPGLPIAGGGGAIGIPTNVPTIHTHYCTYAASEF